MGMTIRPHFSKKISSRGVNRKATIHRRGEDPIVEDVLAPEEWSQNAINIVASRYFRGNPGEADRERSVYVLVDRVVGAITKAGGLRGYFSGTGDMARFRGELWALLLDQRFAFNSPVWFNLGAEDKPQCSACFINGVEDNMGSILNLVKEEGMIFKGGSGAGSNLSNLRGSKEPLGGGGYASGPVSFMRGFDAFAGVIKSGGKTRRAAKMVLLDVDHPDILDFIECKMKADRAAKALIAQGYPADFDDVNGAYAQVAFQNANHSVRLSDAFMQAVEEDSRWSLINRTDGKACVVMAGDLFESIAEAAHECGDPGVQFSDAITRMHTCPEDGAIEASNPCSEYMFLSDTSCNLASLNLAKFLNEDGTLNVEDYQAAIRLITIAMDIIVDLSSYPTEAIAEKTKRYRTLGVGFSNLGAALMTLGLPYDSDEGRAVAAEFMSLMTATVYQTSQELAEDLGAFEAFEGYDDSRDPMRVVISQHRYHSGKGRGSHLNGGLADLDAWKNLTGPFRNAQATVLAPTGTISFLMDCSTTGCEPAFALESHKALVGGGTVKQTLPCIPEGADLSDPIYQCAMSSEHQQGLPPEAHLKMMAALQPFVSGAISKTVNLPAEATVDDVKEVYMSAWRLGLKAVAVYRDGSKGSQPLTTKKEEPLPPRWEFEPVPEEDPGQTLLAGALRLSPKPTREKLPATRMAVNHRFEIAGNEGYLNVGLYEDGRPGELFVHMSKEGSTVAGMLNAWSILFSVSLQHGRSLESLVERFKHMRFEPSGITNNPDIRLASSIPDYIARWMELEFLGPQIRGTLTGLDPQPQEEEFRETLKHPEAASSGNTCPTCGTMMQRSGTCETCPSCGATSGGCS